MNYLQILSKLHNLKTVDREMVSNLYSLSQKSIVSVVAFSLPLSYVLYPVLHEKIVIWLGTIIVLAVIRLLFAYSYTKKSERFSLETWHKIFMGFAFFTAFLFSLLGFAAIPQLPAVYQVFLVAVLIGLTSGAMSSLFPDIRIMLGYSAIILFPLTIVLISINTVMHLILALLIVLYFITQVTIVLNSYQQSKEIERKKAQIAKEQLRLYKREETLQHFFKHAPIGIFSYDKQLHVTGCNEAFLRLFGLKKEEIIGKNLNAVPDKNSVEVMKKALTDGMQSYIGPYLSIKGYEYWVEAKCSPLYDPEHKVVGGIGLIENKTKEYNAVKKLKFLAQHDPLTNLYNRRGFHEYMQTLIHAEAHKKSYSLLFYLDLNQFKGINDSLGHTVGDNILVIVAERLTEVLGEECKISRLGGDEFIVVIPYVSSEAEVAREEAGKYAQKIKSVFSKPFILKNLHLRINASIGIIIIEPENMDVEEIIRHADLTMYQAKNSSGHLAYYNHELDKEQKKLFGLQHDLVYAAERGQLHLFFQPIVRIKDDTLFSAELLIRWDHPKRGLLSPEEFIPLAIKAGLLSDITWWILDNVCQYIVQWKQENRWKLDYISININAQQLIEEQFAVMFLEKLHSYGVETKDIMIEITERSLIDNFESTQSVINTLRSHGIRCAIDDFGIGYSSLSYLKKLSFNTLKIDKAFIKEIEHKPKELLLVSTILNIGRQFDYNIVIEGIEEERQKQLLLELDDTLSYQGFYFSKPLHVHTFMEKFLS